MAKSSKSSKSKSKSKSIGSTLIAWPVGGTRTK